MINLQMKVMLQLMNLSFPLSSWKRLQKSPLLSPWSICSIVYMV